MKRIYADSNETNTAHVIVDADDNGGASVTTTNGPRGAWCDLNREQLVDLHAKLGNHLVTTAPAPAVITGVGASTQKPAKS